MKKGQNKSFATNHTWLYVKKDIEAKIVNGEYIAGSKIPTIVELGEQYNIGKTTAQKIINALYDEGTIVKKVGIGCFVKPYIKERLSKQHEQELKKQITIVVNEALSIGIDKNKFIEIVNEEWKEPV